MNCKKVAIMVWMLLTAAVPVWGQSDDEVVSGSDDLRYEHSVPLAGSKVANTISGRRVYSDDFSRFFFEGVALISDYDYGVGFGGTMAYVPGRWGVYGTMMGEPLDYRGYIDRTFRFNAGGVVRPVMSASVIDWQLYGGLSIGRTVGVEIGTRFAPSADINGLFGWWSCSIGKLYTPETSYLMLGISINIALFSTTFFIF